MNEALITSKEHLSNPLKLLTLFDRVESLLKVSAVRKKKNNIVNFQTWNSGP